MRLGKSTKAVLLLYVPSFGVLFAIYLLARIKDLPIGTFTWDPAAIANVHPLVGVLSNIGVLLWSWTAAVCIFTGFVVLRTTSDKSEAYYFLSFGFLTLLLSIDDFFLFHEVLAERYLGLGEKTVYSAYLILTMTYIAHYWRKIVFDEPLLLVIALAGFGTSLAADLFLEPLLEATWSLYYLLEDGSKFLGIVGWFGYFVVRSYKAMTKIPRV